MAQERAAWRGIATTMTTKLNDQLETSEKERKDGWKVRRKEGIQLASIELRCEEPGCMFVGQMKAGLVNHTRQRHGSKVQLQHKCTFCDKSFHKQGIIMHMKHCRMNPDGRFSQVACIAQLSDCRGGGGGGVVWCCICAGMCLCI